MLKLFQGGRHHPPAHVNKPLPEPLVDPDEGKTPIGELIIIPIQGRDLPNRERFGKQNPFILFKLGNVSRRTSTDVRGGQRPRWNDDQICISVYASDAKDAKSLFVTCLDEDHQKNELIADCVINLDKVFEHGQHDDWFELRYKGREAGELMLQLTYYAQPSHNDSHVAPGGIDPHVAMNGFSGYPSAGLYPPVNANKHPALPVQQLYPPLQDGGAYPPAAFPNPSLGYPPQRPIQGQSGYPPQQPIQGQSGYPPAQYNTMNRYPPQLDSFNNGYPPQFNNTFHGYPPQEAFYGNYSHNGNNSNNSNNGNNYNNNNNTNNNMYPPVNNFNIGVGGLYPPVQQPLSRPASAPGSVGYPPMGYPFPTAASNNLYPPTQVSGSGYPPPPPSTFSHQNPSMPLPVPALKQESVPQTFASSSYPGTFPGAFPTPQRHPSPPAHSTNSDSNNSSHYGSTLAGHKQSVSTGYPATTLSSPVFPGEYPRPRSTSPPALPPRNQIQPRGLPSYEQAIYGA
ncbi:hypothetical protein BGZ98_000884 [Dissophora globulifera]|nr:hypothetical protein BGZ98_000884 [Dissophora globulifera]